MLEILHRHDQGGRRVGGAERPHQSGGPREAHTAAAETPRHGEGQEPGLPERREGVVREGPRAVVVGRAGGEPPGEAADDVGGGTATVMGCSAT